LGETSDQSLTQRDMDMDTDTDTSPQPVTVYRASLQRELQRGHATGHAHPRVLEALAESAAPGQLATHEPKATQRENKPDYIVRKSALAIDFVQAKDTHKTLKATGKAVQIKRCLEALPGTLRPRFSAQGNHEVEKLCLEVVNGAGRVWINARQYFDGVPQETRDFKLSGDQVCEKWLQGRKGRF
jgi:Type ISP C-terminal specificity domain